MTMQVTEDAGWFNRDFIAVQDNAMSCATCERLVSVFERSDDRQQGRIGSGVDVDKKLSTDIVLEGVRWAAATGAVQSAMRAPVERYMAEYPHALMGAISPSIRRERDQQMVPLTIENWKDLGAPIASRLVWRAYRFGTINLQKYERGRGGYHHWHSEIFPKRESSDALHRVLLVMVYLNDVTEGGETEFFHQRMKVQPRQGRVVIAPAGFTHTHRGSIPLSHDKFIATTWVMFQPADALYGDAD